MQSADSAGLKSFSFSRRDRNPARGEPRGSDTEKDGLFGGSGEHGAGSKEREMVASGPTLPGPLGGLAHYT